MTAAATAAAAPRRRSNRTARRSARGAALTRGRIALPEATLVLVLALGWSLQLASWLATLARTGRRAATRREWPREVLIRIGMAGLVVGALADRSPPAFPPPPVLGAVLGLLFAAGQLLATWARASLGPSAWSIGVEPRGPAATGGPYRSVPHPIYLGTGVALLAQAALLQNLPALLLAAGAALVIPLKVIAEARRLRAR